MDIAISTLIREFRESRNGYVHFTLDLEKRKRKKERKRKRERRRERRTARAHATERERRTARAHATERERRTAARKKEKYGKVRSLCHAAEYLMAPIKICVKNEDMRVVFFTVFFFS